MIKRVYNGFKRRLGQMRNVLRSRFFPVRAKRHSELAHWKWMRKKRSDSANSHFHALFTTVLGLDDSDFADKRILDIGCGPLGTLEWATMAKQRVGLDPLADRYRQESLIGDQQMEYVNSRAEEIPFEDGRFDFVSTINSLDHVEDVSKVVREIARVVCPGGEVLLVTDVNHDPTPTEPQTFEWSVLEMFDECFDRLDERHYEREPIGSCASVYADVRYDHSNKTRRYGVLLARLRRK